MNIDTALLRSFVVLAEELHFARAAERLYIEQPALSQRIRRLERRVGAELFIRDTRNVRLTPAGAGFLNDVTDVLKRLDDAVTRAREVESGNRGALRLAYTLSVGYEALPILLADVDEELPGLEVEALEMWEKDVLIAMSRRTSDVGLVRYDPDDPELVSVLVRREPLILAVPHGHHLADRSRVRLAELSGERFVITPSSLAPGYQGLIEQVFAAAGFVPRAVANPVPGSRVMSVLKRNAAVALLPASAQLVHPVGVAAFIPIEEDFAALPVRLLHRADAGAAVRAFVDRVQRIARDRHWV
jgi:DNA-binding transcriptional LysR family regulator